MPAQEYSFYKRPDTSNVTWFTPQQLEQARLNRTIAPVRVREITPVARTTPDENADPQNILANAKHIVAACLKDGSAQIHHETIPSLMPTKGVWTLTARTKKSRQMKRIRNKRSQLLSPNS